MSHLLWMHDTNYEIDGDLKLEFLNDVGIFIDHALALHCHVGGRDCLAYHSQYRQPRGTTSITPLLPIYTHDGF